MVAGNLQTNPYGAVKFEGLGKPDVRSGNQDKAQAPGAWVGMNQLKSRQIVVTMDISKTTTTTLPQACAALRTMCSTEGSTEYPFWIQLPGFPLVCCMARVIKAPRNWDVLADLGGLIQGAAIGFEATDPYFYLAPTTSTSIGLPSPATGMVFPLSFNLSFGGGITPNQATIVNAGNVTCWPVLQINGPCINPTVSNTSIAGNPTLSFNIQLFAGDQLIVDCSTGAVLYYPSGQSVGSPLQNILNPGSEYWGLPPGSSVCAFNSQDTSSAAGTVSIWSSSALDSLI